MLPGQSHRDASARRRVAVLFADISGFTRLVETVEPEIVYQLVRPFLDELVDIVHVNGGEIQQVLGDGFMAVFGVRFVRGDEAVRAVRAGLALVTAGRSHPSRLPVHVGIEYGEVLVTPSWQVAEFGVWGRPVNLAKRLCDLAGPDEIQIGPGAFARARHGIGPVTTMPARLKGVIGAVTAHRVAGDGFEPLAQAT
ncbi:MAG TPA: adenylate/guanylate cyclase domain-containing protein [Micromonosporaceae bacterium]